MGRRGRHAAPVVRAAQHLVRHDVPALACWALTCALSHIAHHHLLALGDHQAVDGARVVGGPGAAPAQGLDLQHLDPVGELHQAGAARKQPGAEVGGDPERVDVDAQLVDDPRQVVHLVRGVELRLVADQVVHPLTRLHPVDHQLPDVRGRIDLDGGHGQAEAAGQQARPGPVAGHQDQPAQAPRGVVVVGLQGERGLAGVHRPGEEHQRGHRLTPSRTAAGCADRWPRASRASP